MRKSIKKKHRLAKARLEKQIDPNAVARNNLDPIPTSINTPAGNFIRGVSYEQDVETEKPFQKRKRAFYGRLVPVLPFYLAVTCCTLNIVLPGIGSLVAGVLVLVLPRIFRDSQFKRMQGEPFFIMLIGLSQLFLVCCVLIGWFWSITWAFWMVEVSYGVGSHKAQRIAASTEP